MANGKNKILQKIFKKYMIYIYITSQRENLFYNFYLITLKFKIDNIIADNYNDNLVGKQPDQ